MQKIDIALFEIALPEAVEREKSIGNFDKARKIINDLLESPATSEVVKDRLNLEKEVLRVLENQYSLTEDEVQREAEAVLVGNDTIADLCDKNKIPYIYIDGQRHILSSFKSSYIRSHEEELGIDMDKRTIEFTWFESLLEEGQTRGFMKESIGIRHQVDVKLDETRLGNVGDLKVHIPCPVERSMAENVRIGGYSPDLIKLPTSEEHQPCAFYQGKGNSYFLEYEVDNVIQYRDLTNVKDEFLTMDSSGLEMYLCEKKPHIRFTEFIRRLAEEIIGDEDCYLRKARKIYDYITTKVNYMYVADYITYSNISEYCAMNFRGDCGFQVIMFITLCRVAGIPATWESGIDVKGSGIGPHDWAKFYISGIGWCYADLSYGNDAYNRGEKDIWNFYFGNVDPYRVAINDDIQNEFVPCKRAIRFDPVDNQCGEVEGEDGSQIDYAYSYERI